MLMREESHPEGGQAPKDGTQEDQPRTVGPLSFAAQEKTEGRPSPNRAVLIELRPQHEVGERHGGR
jgi:hypothetical protein